MVWGPVVLDSERIPENERDCYLGAPRFQGPKPPGSKPPNSAKVHERNGHLLGLWSWRRVLGFFSRVIHENLPSREIQCSSVKLQFLTTLGLLHLSKVLKIEQFTWVWPVLLIERQVFPWWETQAFFCFKFGLEHIHSLLSHQGGLRQIQSLEIRVSWASFSGAQAKSNKLQVHLRKRTWHWKIPPFSIGNTSSKSWTFHCHVSFRGGGNVNQIQLMAVDPSTKVRHLSLHPSAFLNMGRFLERNIASNERERGWCHW